MGGAVASFSSVIVSASSGPGSSPGWGHCIVFFTLTVPLSTQEYKWVGTGELIVGGNPEMD